MSNNDHEVEGVTGYLYTHIDCPHCAHTTEVEGDMTDETVTCENCEAELKVGSVL